MDTANSKFFVVQSWMVSKLGLKGLDLLLYAIIAGYSQDEESEFYGSLTYLSEMTGCTKRGIIKSLNYLVENEFIIRHNVTVNSINTTRYRMNYKKLSDMEQSSQVVNSVHGVVNSVHTPVNSVHTENNLNKNNINNNIYISTRAREYENEFDKFWEAYPKHTNTSKKEAYKKFCKALEKTDIETILNAIENQKKTRQWIEGFIPMATTWLNQERWEDEVEIYTEPEEKAPKKTYTENDTAWKNANWLSRKLNSLHPTIKQVSDDILQVWASVFDRMETEEGHPAGEILRLMKYAFQDDFWQTRITSPWEVKKHYVKLLAQAEKDGWFN